MAGEFVYEVKVGDQVVGTRTSKRTYSHAIVARRSKEYEVKTAREISGSSLSANDYKYGTRYAGMTREQAIEKIEADNIGRPPFHTEYEMRALDKNMAESEAMKAQHPTLEVYRQWYLDEWLARIATAEVAGVYDKFNALTWAGRPDLAEKEYTKAKGDPRFAEVLKVPAEVAHTVGLAKQVKANALAAQCRAALDHQQPSAPINQQAPAHTKRRRIP